MVEFAERFDRLEHIITEMAGTRLTREQVCERLGVSARTLHTIVHERGFPRAVEGKWRLADILEWERFKARAVR